MRRVLLVLGVVLLVIPSNVIGGKKGGMEKAREAIRKADLDFARALKDKDMDKFKSFLQEEATFYGSQINRGREAVTKAWSVFFEVDAKQTLLWEPYKAEVSASGDLGYTAGEYEIRSLVEGGDNASLHGHYVTIWKKVGGSWQAIVDIGTPPAPHKAESAKSDG
jgi:ketosteroid isomerase-like protein